MNQGTLEVVKQEMARVNIDILISELKWMGMDKFNSDDHYIYHHWQESLRRNGVVLKVNKRIWNAVLGCNLKNDRKISVHFQGKPFSIKIIQVYAPTTNAREDQELLELTPKKSSFHHRGCCSVAQSCLTRLWPYGLKYRLSVLQHLPKFAQTYVYWVSDAMQLSHPPSSPSPPARSRSQHQGLF